MRLWRALLTALLALLLGAAGLPLHAQDVQAVPALSARVIDTTGTLPAAERDALEQRLAAFEAQAGPQIVLLMVATTAPEDIAACQAAGMAYFVSKPLTPPALLGALQHVLSEIDDQAADEAA